MRNSSAEPYVTKIEIAKHLHVSTRTIDNFMARHVIPFSGSVAPYGSELMMGAATLARKYRIASVN